MTTSAIGTIRLDRKVIGKLLDLLGTDDSFRALFQQSPYVALTQAGYVANDKAFDAVMQAACQHLIVKNLVSKDIVKNCRASMEAQLQAGLGMQPIQLNMEHHTKRAALAGS